MADAVHGLAEAIEQADMRCTHNAAANTNTAVSKRARNEQLPEHLPRYEVEAAIPDDVQNYEQNGERKLIGHASRRLRLNVTKLKVRVRRSQSSSAKLNLVLVWPNHLECQKVWSRASATTPSRRKFSPPNRGFTCRSTGSKIGSAATRC